MFNILYLFIIVLFAFYCKPENSRPVPEAVQGVLDLQDWDFGYSEDSTIELNGEWEFYPHEFLDPHEGEKTFSRPQDLFSHPQEKKYIRVPGAWNDFPLDGKPFGADGFASYKLKIFLPERKIQTTESEVNTPSYSISIPSVGTEFSMYINGELVASRGKVGKTKEESQVFIQRTTIDLSKKLANNQNLKQLDILFHVSSFHHSQGGLWLPLQMGYSEKIAEILKRRFVLDLIVFSSLLIMGLYHLGLFLGRKKDKSPLYFSIFCILLSFRTLSVNDRMLLDVFPFLPFWFVHDLEYFSFFYASFVFGQFIYSLYPKEFSHKVLVAFAVVLIPCSLAVVFLPMKVYIQLRLPVQITTLTAILYSLKVLIHAVINKKLGARLFLLGFIFFALTVIHDILVARGFIFTPYVASYGVLVFVFFQSAILSLRFANGLTLAEKLSEELKQKSDRLEETSIELKTVNENLERKIEERTQILENAKKEIEFLNEFSTVINSSNKLEEIFQEAVFELNQRYKADMFLLQLVDEEKNELFTRCFSAQVSMEDFEKINSLRIPIREESGSVYIAADRKKTLYVKSNRAVQKENLSDIDRYFNEVLEVNSTLQIPLVVKDKVIGIFHLNRKGGMRRLQKEEIRFIESLCEQLAIAVYNSYLFEEADRQKKETEQLNKLMKNINSVSSLTDIMTFIMLYLERSLGFKDFALLLHEELEKKLQVHFYVSVNADKKSIEELKNTEINITGLQGGFVDICKTKKLQYIPKEEILENDSVSLMWIEKGKLDYLLLSPLIVYNELVGVLMAHAHQVDLPITDSILSKFRKACDLISGSIFNAKLLKKIEEAHSIAESERKKSEKLLLNILPKDVASELKEKGFTEPVLFDSVSVMFTDFKGFTQIAETLTPQALIKDLDACFVQFDKVSERYNLEKLKTIGDSYMCAGGIPRKNTTHAIDCVLAALEIQAFMNLMKRLKEERGFPYWEIRLGIHSDPLVAGVIGEKKFAYDVWGDTVNTASRMESSGTTGKINISGTTYELVKEFFICDYRGKVNAKNKGEVDMYYVHGLKEELSRERDRKTPNGKFWDLYSGNF